MSAYIVAAKRTPVAPRGGAYTHLEVYELGARTIASAIQQSGVPAEKIDNVIMGNALYAGGNPARVAALAAGLAESVPAMTIDSQCCAGLDAINTACAMVNAGGVNAVVAGGLESFSRAPVRAHRPKNKHDPPKDYQRPPFTPWPQRDPNMIEAAAALARQREITRQSQEQFAIRSHEKAQRAIAGNAELVSIGDLCSDAFTRKLSTQLCSRLPLIAGDAEFGLTSSTIAVEADAAAAVVVVNEKMLPFIDGSMNPVVAIGCCSIGSDPALPALAPIAAIRKLLRQTAINSRTLQVAEIMEAFAVQAMVCIDECDIDPAIVNRGGGALARGHPIGASGAILAVRLWHELQKERSGAYGVTSIAAAGGLGSAALWRTG